jgi:hypothetical protein
MELLTTQTTPPQPSAALIAVLVSYRDSQRKDIEHTLQLLQSLGQSLTPEQRWFYAEGLHDHQFRARMRMKHVSSELRETLIAFMSRHPELRWGQLRIVQHHIQRVDATRIRLVGESRRLAGVLFALWLLFSVTWMVFLPQLRELFHGPTNLRAYMTLSMLGGAWLVLFTQLTLTFGVPALVFHRVRRAIERDQPAAPETAPRVAPSLVTSEIIDGVAPDSGGAAFQASSSSSISHSRNHS